MDRGFGIHTKILIWMTVLLVLLGVTAVAVADEPRSLDDSGWRDDIAAVADAIRDIHPRPFRTTGKNEFDASYRQLLDDVPELTDKEIIVRLAALVALVDDGHTRLAIPREHSQIGLAFGHTPTPQPTIREFRFRQLPLGFSEFVDGVFVVGASASHAELIGYRLDTVDGLPIAETMAAIRAICFADNDQLASLMGTDRLSLPEALAALGITRSADVVELGLTGPDGQAVVVPVEPLSAAPTAWAGPFPPDRLPLRLRNAEKPFWSEYVSDGGFVYLQMDEIADGDIPLAQFITSTLDLAIEKNARLIIDVRNNFGGSGGLNRTLVTSIIASEDLNRRGRTFVLIGRRTFSAAQMLVNELERYTRVIFVGEPTGSRPDHYGDPEKIRLENSGLTLRVSRLHWSSYTAFDERQATNPDFLVPWSSADYFDGADPALSFAASREDPSLGDLLRAALLRGDMQQIARHTIDSRLSPDTYAEDFSHILVDLGEEFLASGKPDTARLAYQVGLYFYPNDDRLNSALSRLKSP